MSEKPNLLSLMYDLAGICFPSDPILRGIVGMYPASEPAPLIDQVKLHAKGQVKLTSASEPYEKGLPQATQLLSTP